MCGFDLCHYELLDRNKIALTVGSLHSRAHKLGIRLPVETGAKAEGTATSPATSGGHTTEVQLSRSGLVRCQGLTVPSGSPSHLQLL